MAVVPRETGSAPISRPPRVESALLRLLIQDPDHEFLAGDLEEIYQEMALQEGRRRARRWFRRQTLLSLYFWIRLRLQRPLKVRKDDGKPMIDGIRKDLFFALRLAFKRPGFSLVVILTLALGIGANTAVYSLIDAFLFRGLPVPDSDRLVSIFNQNPDGSFHLNLSYAQIRDFDGQSQSLTGVLGFSLVRASLNHDGLTETLFGEAVTANYFEVLQVAPQLGRTFVAAERGRSLDEPVIILSHGLWQRRFGADPGITGKTLQLNNTPFTVVGVAPPEFRGSKFALSMSFWVPVQVMPLLQGWGDWDSRQNNWLNGFGRLAEGVTLQEVRSELELISGRLQQDFPGQQRRRVARVQWARGAFTELSPALGAPAGAASGLAIGVAVLILLIACVNVANLVLAKTSTRISEIGLRLAIGASRSQIMRQLSWESLVLALAGGALGVVLAFVGTASLPLLFPTIPYEIHFPTDPSLPVLGLTLLVTTATGLLFGFIPLLALRREGGLNVQANLAGIRSVRGGWSSRRFLVVLQIAASLLLLVISGLFIRSLRNGRLIDPGFSNSNLLMAMLDLNVASYTPEAGSAVLPDLESRLASIAGVDGVGLTNNLPLDDSNESTLVWAQGVHLDEADGIGAEYVLASPGFFPALGIRLREGRLFDNRDRADTATVAVISRSLGERLWPGQPAPGRMLSVSGPDGPFLEVAGVVDDVRYESLSKQDQPAIYFSLGQRYSSVLRVVLRTALPPASLAPGVRSAVRGLNPNIPVVRVMSFEDQISNQLWPSRMGAVLASVFGAIALLLASVGLYGLMSFAVSRRIREMGIRTALGANPRDLLLEVLLSGSRLVLAGLGAGTFLSLIASRPISGLFYGGGGVDILTLGVVVSLLASVALFACYLPARRASRVDPMEALRYE